MKFGRCEYCNGIVKERKATVDFRRRDGRTTLIRREFVVNVSLEAAWAYLVRVADWPCWAEHVKRIDLEPPGQITANSTGYSGAGSR